MSEPVFLTVMRIWRRKWRLLQAKTRPRVRRTSQNRPCLRKGAEVLKPGLWPRFPDPSGRIYRRERCRRTLVFCMGFKEPRSVAFLRWFRREALIRRRLEEDVGPCE